MKAVYVIVEDGGCSKIGIADNPRSRLNGLQTSHPRALTLVHTKQADDARLVERVAHALLKGKRASGEWFHVTPEEAICAIDAAIELINAGDEAAVLEERGGSRFPTLTLSPAETELWERLMAQDTGDQRGKAKRTLVRALHALAGKNDLSQEQIIDWIKAHAK